jgi:hypothetical protein
MNWIAKASCSLTAVFVTCAACNVPATESVADGKTLSYQVGYTVTPRPTEGVLEVAMRVAQPRSLLRELRFPADTRISDQKGDGELLTDDGETGWRPPAIGGTLRWTVSIANRRNSSGYDAWLDDSWGVMRAEDLIPRAATRTVRGSVSETTLRFNLPKGWSAVTAYAEVDGKFSIDKAGRRFDQPDGWIVMGHLGIRYETIAGIRVSVAGPVGHSVRRMDTLALLSWTLPELLRVIPDVPRRLTIVSAGDPMWRGGLSAPQSLYIHAGRPLISENATSTLLHEVMHSTLRLTGKEGYDWIVEGLAEYYSLELLRRSGSISQGRFDIAIANQLRWSKSADRLCQRSSSGAATAMAVGIFAALDAEIRHLTDGASSLDDVLQQLHRYQQPVDLQFLRQISFQLTNTPSAILAIEKLPGCRSAVPGNQGNE